MTLPVMIGDAPLIRAAIARLQQYMPGQVAAFNNEGANTVQLKAPDNASYHFGGNDLLATFAYPQIEVAVVTGDMAAWAIGRSEVNYDPRVNVSIWQDGADGGGDIPILYETVVGLKRCVVECLAGVGAFGVGVEISQRNGISSRVDVVPFDPTAREPAEGRRFQKWLGSALIQFRLETVEHFT